MATLHGGTVITDTNDAGTVDRSLVLTGAVNNITLNWPDAGQATTLSVPDPGAATDTLALTSATQTLSNKTLASPTVTTALTINATGELRLADTDSTNYVGFEAPGTVSANQIWVLPAADGTAGQLLKTDGAGNLGWVDPFVGTLSGLSDTAIATPAAGELLIYDGVDSWDNQAVSGAIAITSTGATSLNAGAVDAITEIAAALRSGADPTLVTGTAGTNGNLAQWNIDGDIVNGPTPPTGAIVGTTDTQTLTNKTVSGGTLSGTTTYTNAGTGTNPTLASNNAAQVLTLTGTLEADGVDIVNAGTGANPKLSSNSTSQTLDLTGSLTISADLTVNGTTTTINTTTLYVADANITINSGGTQASAAGAGLAVEMSDATNVTLLYDSTLASRWKIGDSGSEAEIADVSSVQTLTNKTLGAGSALSANLNAGGNDITALGLLTQSDGLAAGHDWTLGSLGTATSVTTGFDSQLLKLKGSTWDSDAATPVAQETSFEIFTNAASDTNYQLLIRKNEKGVITPLLSLDMNGNLRIAGTLDETTNPAEV